MREITARQVMHEGKLRWRVIVPRALNSGVVGRRYYTGKGAEERAVKKAAELEALRAKAGVRLLAMPESDQVAVMHAVDALRPSGRVKEIGEAVRLYLQTKAALSVPVTNVVGECLAEKSRGNLSPRYLRGIRTTLEKFCIGRETKPIDEVTANEIEDFLARLGKAVSRRSQLIDLRTLFSYALRRGYVRANTAGLVAMPQRDEMEPGILTIPQVRHVLYWVQLQHPEIMRFVALVLFGGVRPDEAKLLDSSMIKDDCKLIDIPASISKTNRRRLIETNATFRAFHALGGALPLQEWQARKVRELVRPWPHDALRHSFVSYSLAIHGEVSTAAAAGHSISVLHKHYKATVTKTDAEAFWNLRPSKNGQ